MPDRSQQAHAEPAPDGRRSRWDDHNRARREAFVEAAMTGIRKHGPDVGMDAIAAEAGVSKTVLYRHFTDKADLHAAVLERIASDVVLPRLARKMVVELPDVDRVRAVVSAYIGLIVAEPRLYRFAMGRHEHGEDFVATTERAIAEGLTAIFAERLESSGLDAGGAQTWAYGVVGMVQLAAHRWMDEPVIPVQALEDYLVTLVWGGVGAVLGGTRPRSVSG